MKILITGFKSRQDKTNASDILVSSLIDALPASLESLSNNIDFAIVTDDAFALKNELEKLILKIKPTHCLFTGQAPGYNRVTLETIATNYMFTSPPANVWEPPEGCEIEKEGNAAYHSTLQNPQAVIQSIKEKGIPASLSHNCGNSRCNQILYHGLHYAKAHNIKPICGFLHIPALPEQIIKQWPQHPFMPLEMTRSAVEIVINSFR